MKSKARFALAAAILLLAGSLAGCGGGSSRPGDAAGTGGVAFTVVWPERPSRLIPAGANLIVIRIKRGETLLREASIARPATTLIFNGLPTGTLIAEASAHPSPTETAQAAGTVPLEILPDRLSAAVLTMDSTITTVEVTPTDATIVRGRTVPLTATPRDRDGRAVLVPPGNLIWSSSNEAAATVSAGGVATGGGRTVDTGLGRGVARITVTESESGKSGGATLANVNPIVYVTDGYPGGGQVVSLEGTDGSQHPTFGAGQLDAPLGIAADAAERLYVADRNNNRLVRLNADGSGFQVLLSDPVRDPRGVAVDRAGSVYFTHEPGGAGRVARINADGTGYTEIFIEGIELSRPTGIAVDRSGRIYVTDRDNDLIFRVNPDGTGLTTIGTEGNFSILRAPAGVAVGGDDRVYVADTENNRIMRVIGMGQASPQISYLSAFFSGSGTGTFFAPTGVSVDAENRVYVLDAGNLRIVRIDDFDSGTAQVFALPFLVFFGGIAVFPRALDAPPISGGTF